MTLCAHRPEGFGPQSALHSLPTTCFIDVIVVPLATWIYLAIAVIAVPFIYLRQRKTVTYKAEDGAYGSPSTAKPSILKRILSVLYYLLIVAMLAMVSLVLARMSVADLGIGLLPFTYVGILLALAVHVLLRSKLGRGLNVLYWVMLAVVMAIEVATIATEGVGSRVGTAAQKNYPYSDGITDFSTMIGVEAVLAVLEFVS